MSDFPLTGGCLCGYVRYQILDRPQVASICHCATCRRASGAASLAWAIVARPAFDLLRGEPAKYHSSPGVTRTFCPTCGTTLTFEDGVETIDVALATLDDPEQLKPTREVWVEHAISWNLPHPDRRHYPGAGDQPQDAA